MTNPETVPMSHAPASRRFMESLASARKAREGWAAANPTLAADWDAANNEDAARERDALASKEAARRREAVLAMCSDVGMPQRALDAIKRPQDTEAVKTLSEGPKDSMALLAGPPGTGKTVAAVGVAHAAMASAYGKNPERVKESPSRVAMFVRAVTLARMSAYGAEAQATMDRLTSTRLLILDDLGAEFASSVWDMLLFEILDTRHGDMLPTILTSNLGAQDFAKRYGTRMLERIKEGGTAVFLNGSSMRGVP